MPRVLIHKRDSMMVDQMLVDVKGNPFGKTWYVNSSTGANTNSGKDPYAPLLTIAKAVALASAGDTICAIGTGFSEAVTVGSSLTGLKIIGVGTGPNQTTWTGAADAVCLNINATDVTVQGIKFRPPAYTAGTPAAIVLGGANYAHILNCLFQGKAGSYIAIYSPVCNSDDVEIGFCQFKYLNNITTVYGSAILGVEAGGLSYSTWFIHDCDFDAPVEGININGRGCLILNCQFRVNGLKADGTMGAVTGSAGSKKMIDLSGTSSADNSVHGCYLGAIYSSTLYAVSAAGDDWAGNFNIAGITTANPT